MTDDTAPSPPGLFSDADRERIRGAIAEAETRTSGEVFAVVARTSDDYRFVPIAWAAAIALAVPLALMLLTRLSVQQIYLAQLLTFAGLMLLFSIPAVKMRLVPRRLAARRAERHAAEQFLAHGIHTKPGRTGVLVFISLAEHHAQIVADAEIDARVDQKVWEEAVALLVEGMRTERPADGFVAAVAICGEALARHFPRGPEDVNSLDDHLVEL